MYIWGFYKNFEVDIFQFMSFMDVIVRSFKALCMMILMTIFWIISPLLMDYFKINFSFTIFTRKSVLILIAIFFLICEYKIYLSYNSLLLTPIAVLLFDIFTFNKLKNFSLRMAIIMILLLIPLVAYDLGQYNAIRILDNIDYQYTFESKNNVKNELKYIGFSNNKYFFISMNNDSIYIFNNIDKLILQTHNLENLNKKINSLKKTIIENEAKIQLLKNEKLGWNLRIARLNQKKLLDQNICITPIPLEKQIEMLKLQSA
jgi:hypothetical protein